MDGPTIAVGGGFVVQLLALAYGYGRLTQKANTLCADMKELKGDFKDHLKEAHGKASTDAG